MASTPPFKNPPQNSPPVPTSLTPGPALRPTDLANPLMALIQQTIINAGGWIAFDQYMAMALYTPQWGYYSSARQKFGPMPASGSDFVTAPELSPMFGQALAQQVHQALQVTGTQDVWEFGAGTGALALQVLNALDTLAAKASHVGGPATPIRYHIVELSADLQTRQQSCLAAYGERVQWHTALPATLEGVVLGNEVLDAMPVRLVVRTQGVWHERGVTVHDGHLAFADRVLPRPEIDDPGASLSVLSDIPGEHDYLTEVPTHAVAFVNTLAERLCQGAAFFIDYGFPAAEFYHPQRDMGTLVCHKGHQLDFDPLALPGDKDITAHVDFTAIALAWQTTGDARTLPIEMGTLGFCNQARFLINCGLGDALGHASPAQRSAALRLINEHEMGELFKVIGLYVGQAWDALGFSVGDKSHTL